MSAPEIGDRVCYWGRSERLVSGVLAERAIGPLTGNPRYRVVDSWREAADPDAGRWVGIELVHRIDPPEAEQPRPCPACGRLYDPTVIPPPRVPLDIRCACCCQ
jgi:hypothetical protein